ncbi:hypothetical protein [Aphanizomenon sp. UHCC 0183]|uniref:hypothetical protein n=1 Tax=Aphanizomenon sp. UHCC 0183 TaxID=2590028 RepID=UPI00144621F9|nr:hypothetical protein [Aphanizomenon sp. UHCC 0183]
MLKKLIIYSTCLSLIGCQTIENPLANVMRMFVFGYLVQIMKFSKVESYLKTVNMLFKLLHLKGQKPLI